MLSCRSLSISLVLIALAAASPANAGRLVVFADTHIWGDAPLSADDGQMALNMLGAGTAVLTSTQGDGWADALVAFYDAQPGISHTRTDLPLTALTLLGIDLLVLDIDFNDPSPYDALETGAIADFLLAGGDVAMIGETSVATDIDTYNQLLLDIGGTIQFVSVDRTGGGAHLADTLLPTYLTAGVSEIEVAAYHDLSGGTAVIQDLGVTLVAFEVVPEPGSGLLLAAGLAALAERRRRDRRVREQNP